MPGNEKKLFVGSRVRRLRRELALTQAQMAEALGISGSYLNLIERNQRPVTAQFLLRLTEAFDIDLRTLAGEGDERAVVDLSEVFSDPMFRELPVPRHEIAEVAAGAPAIVDAVTRLYRALLDAKRREEAAQRAPDADDAGAAPDHPVDRVRDFVGEQRNYFATLDEMAEERAAELAATGQELWPALKERLKQRYDLTVRVLPVEVMYDHLRRFDRHRRQLHVSELLDGASRTFAAAYHLGLVEAGAAIEETVQRSGFTDAPTKRLLKVHLASYFAAALMMPYRRFLEAAENLGYDMEILSARFGASFEQVCHRLTTLSRASARGVPFFMLRVDSAGNVSKRFSAGRFPFSRFGGTCPLWTIHATFKIPNRIFTQLVELPDGARYFTISRTVSPLVGPWTQNAPELAIGLGCEARYAGKLVYSRGYDLASGPATPIGVTCRVCERVECPQRAMPPLSKTLIVDEWTRGVAPFRFD